jgi:hypothetical protein
LSVTYHRKPFPTKPLVTVNWLRHREEMVEYARDEIAADCGDVVLESADDLALDPAIAREALAIRRNWSTSDRMERAAWFFYSAFPVLRG